MASLKQSPANDSAAEHRIIRCPAPHAITVMPSAKTSCRAILVGVSVTLEDHAAFSEYFNDDSELVSVPGNRCPVSIVIPWLQYEKPIQVVLVRKEGVMEYKFKLDMVFEIKNGVIPLTFLTETYRGKKGHHFIPQHKVCAFAHFVTF